MIPVPMKATGWYRTYGTYKTSSIRTYTYLGADPNNPIYDGKSWTINSIGLFGYKTSADNKDQPFYKGTPKYDSMLAKLKQDGIIE